MLSYVDYFFFEGEGLGVRGQRLQRIVGYNLALALNKKGWKPLSSKVYIFIEQALIRFYPNQVCQNTIQTPINLNLINLLRNPL